MSRDEEGWDWSGRPIFYTKDEITVLLAVREAAAEYLNAPRDSPMGGALGRARLAEAVATADGL